MEVVKGVEHCWWDLGDRLDVPDSKSEELRRLYRRDHHRMEAVLDYYVKYHPAPSWKHYAAALHKVWLHEQADEVTTKYVKGMDVNHVTCLILIQAVDGQLWYLILISTNQ